MTIPISNPAMEQSLKRIAAALESQNEILKQLVTQEDFSEEDATVKSLTQQLSDAKGRIPGQQTLKS